MCICILFVWFLFLIHIYMGAAYNKNAVSRDARRHPPLTMKHTGAPSRSHGLGIVTHVKTKDMLQQIVRDKRAALRYLRHLHQLNTTRQYKRYIFAFACVWGKRIIRSQANQELHRFVSVQIHKNGGEEHSWKHLMFAGQRLPEG